MKALPLALLLLLGSAVAPRAASADEPLPTQNEPPTPLPPATTAPPPTEPAPPSPPPPALSPTEPAPPLSGPTFTPPPEERPIEEAPEAMSEGRRIVSAWNSGFQWGISPGIGFSNGKAGFLLGARVGYGFDTGTVILVPGVQASGYFLDPTVLLGMPVARVVLPLNRFAPFVEGGVGIGHVGGPASQTGAALSVGGGFMIHFTPSFALGAELNYQAITGTSFKGLALGPIIAFAF